MEDPYSFVDEAAPAAVNSNSGGAVASAVVVKGGDATFDVNPLVAGPKKRGRKKKVIINPEPE